MINTISGTATPDESANLITSPAVSLVVVNDGGSVDGAILLRIKSTVSTRHVDRQILQNEAIEVTTFDSAKGIASVTILSPNGDIPFRLWWSPDAPINAIKDTGEQVKEYLLVLEPVQLIDAPTFV
jgi:hypothetical protein